jgi:hypothetical protein
MPFCDLIGHILHDVQANSNGAISLLDPFPIDPRLLLSNSIRSLIAGLLSLSLLLRLVGRGLYNKLKKRVKDIDEIDNKDNYALLLKKVDLGSAILGFFKEIKRARRVKEAFLTT